MPSIIPGFEYDIFISYRHKDNEYDGWVTTFVENLRKELRATFKEETSIYFDTNPGDGLRETHDVNDSLTTKLRALIFIPIVSQTYCDDTSFAWQHEFLAFRNNALQDHIGLKVNIPNSNVTSRILPVRIHDLDPDDTTLFENAFGGPLRAIDFIYRSPGVNRPLRSNEDRPQENLSHTYYRDQINKVANAVKEVVIGIKSKNNAVSPVTTNQEKADQVQKSVVGEKKTSFWEGLKKRNVVRAAIAYLVVAVLLTQLFQVISHTFSFPQWSLSIVIVFFAIGFPMAIAMAWFFEQSPRGLVRINPVNSASNPYDSTQRKPLTNNIIIGGMTLIILVLYFFPKEIPHSDKSVAVLPFVNISSDPEQRYFSDGMMEEILNQLARIRDLRVTSRTSSMIYRDSKQSLKDISRDLGVANIVEGSVRRYGNNIRISVKLIDARSDKHLWSETFDRDLSDVFSIQTEISKKIAQELRAILTREETIQLEHIPTSNQLAYDYYLKGQYYVKGYSDWMKGIEMSTKAIELDPKFTLAYILRSRLNSLTYFNKLASWEGRDQMAKLDLKKAIELDADLPEVKICEAFTLYLTERNYEEAVRLLQEVQKNRPNDSEVYADLAVIQRRMGLWRESFQNLNKALALDPSNHDYLFRLARLYDVTRDYDKSIEFCNKILDSDPTFSEAVLLKYHSLLAMKGTIEEATIWADRFPDLEELQKEKAYYQKDFNKLAQLLKKAKGTGQQGSAIYKPQSLEFAEVYYYLNQPKLSGLYADSAIYLLQNKLKQSDKDFR